MDVKVVIPVYSVHKETVITGINFVFGFRLAQRQRDHNGLLWTIAIPLTADLWGLTAGKFDQSTGLRRKSVTFVHWEVRPTAGGRLLS